MKLLLLIIPLIISCDTEVVADVDELYNLYTCDLPDQPEWHLVYMGDTSYTKEAAASECDEAYSESLRVWLDGKLHKSPAPCKCEKLN